MHLYLIISAVLGATALAQDPVNPIDLLASALGKTPDQLVSQLSSQYPVYTSQVATATGANLASIQTAISLYTEYTATHDMAPQSTAPAASPIGASSSSTSAAAQPLQSSTKSSGGASIGIPITLAMVAAGFLSVA